jgi:hypothetical protein
VCLYLGQHQAVKPVAHVSTMLCQIQEQYPPVVFFLSIPDFTVMKYAVFFTVIALNFFIARSVIVCELVEP